MFLINSLSPFFSLPSANYAAGAFDLSVNPPLTEQLVSSHSGEDWSERPAPTRLLMDLIKLPGKRVCVCVLTPKGGSEQSEHRVVRETQLKWEHTCGALLDQRQKVSEATNTSRKYYFSVLFSCKLWNCESENRKSLVESGLNFPRRSRSLGGRRSSGDARSWWNVRYWSLWGWKYLHYGSSDYLFYIKHCAGTQVNIYEVIINNDVLHCSRQKTQHRRVYRSKQPQQQHRDKEGAKVTRLPYKNTQFSETPS